MRALIVTHARLMQESNRHLEELARSGAAQERLVASRVLDSPDTWVRWENEHAGLMRPVAAERRANRQTSTLRIACFNLIHRKALFEHLRDQRVQGTARRQLMHFFHRSRGYGHAMIAEHETYLRAACSYLCSSHVGSTVIRDGVFEDPMRRYEELYNEYFRVFCEGALSSDDSALGSHTLLPYLKYQIIEQRRVVLGMPRLVPSALTDAELRRPTGDTERLRVDALRTTFRD